ncbi:helix-turn-helix domain-containing protein [Rhodococcoides fascians]|uniref:helix-turn-helix domain-containing protein n=1 Tax=Rhodococcoides fascians TaxID=1828 RepID=UPI000562CA7B|nr:MULTISPECIES: helix-turn-helix domain-containing protein [Rhodococcus]OZF00559.1 DNA-binding protein [Rhodococcus sp. 15-1189-1-1a]OZF14438.1 DNA-binding protein [Rhodococcus sp. 14-2686-1-2]
MRTHEDYLHGLAGVEVTIPGRIAALIDTRCNLAELRISLRGQDPEVDAVLMAIRLAALHWRTSATGSADAPTPEAEPLSEWVSTAEAANILYCTDRAVRLAINEKRLNATRVGRSYRITREDLEHFKAARNAA